MSRNKQPSLPSRVLVIDYQEAFIYALRQILIDAMEIDMLYSVKTGFQLLEFLQTSEKNIDLIIIGTVKEKSDTANMVYARYLRRYFPQIKIIMISYHQVGAYIADMYQLGVMGYLFRNFDQPVLLECISTVLSGKRYYEGEVKECMKSHKTYLNRPKDDQAFLTPNEKKLLQWLEQGMDFAQIERFVGLRKRSIDVHWKNITCKLGMQDKRVIIKTATEKGWLEEG